jgi:hypothetical protein
VQLITDEDLRISKENSLKKSRKLQFKRLNKPDSKHKFNAGYVRCCKKLTDMMGSSLKDEQKYRVDVKELEDAIDEQVDAFLASVNFKI